MKNLKVLRNEVEGVKIFENSKIEINYIAIDNVYEKDKIFLHEIADSNIFMSPIVPLIGVNSSGKTTALKLFSLANELHTSKRPLSATWINRPNSKFMSLLNNKIILTTYLSSDKELFKVSTILELSNSLDQKYQYEITEEMIWKKKINNLTKAKIFSFSDNDFVTSKTIRETEGFVISNDMSMFSYYINSDYPESSKTIKAIFNATALLEVNELVFENRIDENYAKYLDPSIEILSTRENESGEYLFDFKKITDSEVLTIDNNTLANMLSAGTRRALNMMEFVKVTLLSGGMLYIDEIETNLNKAIIIDLLKLFYSKQTNPFGAILIFSSHYAEILDLIKRNDSIYVLVKGDDSQLNRLVNFSQVLKRKDLKKSEAYISNSLSVTSAPQRRLQRSFEQSIIDLHLAIKDGD